MTGSLQLAFISCNLSMGVCGSQAYCRILHRMRLKGHFQPTIVQRVVFFLKICAFQPCRSRGIPSSRGLRPSFVVSLSPLFGRDLGSPGCPA